MGLPNILITGTPGVGKTTIAEDLCKEILGLEHVNVAKMIRDEGLDCEYDDERQCTVYDDDAVYAKLEALVQETRGGGLVVDFHGVDAMALRRWFNLVIILRADSALVWRRLSERAYDQHKIEENVECEIMRVIRDEVCEYFMETGSCRWEPVAALTPECKPEANEPVVWEVENNDLKDRDNILGSVHRWIAGNYRAEKT